MFLNPWTLGAVAAFGVLMTGRKKTWGWLVLVAAQGMWGAYGLLVVKDVGFLFWATIFASLNLINWHRWRAADRRARLLAASPAT